MSSPITKVYIICNAYESGIGHGLKRDGVCNPYSPGSDEHEAWGIGYKEGIERSAVAQEEAEPVAWKYEHGDFVVISEDDLSVLDWQKITPLYLRP